MRRNPFSYERVYRPDEAHRQSAVSFYSPRAVRIKPYRYKRGRKWIKVKGYSYFPWIVVIPLSPWERAWRVEEMEKRIKAREYPVSRIEGHFQHLKRETDWFNLKEKFIYFKQSLPIAKLGLARVWFWVLNKTKRNNPHWELLVRTWSTGRRAYFPKYKEMKKHILEEEMPAFLEDFQETYGEYAEVDFNIVAWTAWPTKLWDGRTFRKYKIPYHKRKPR